MPQLGSLFDGASARAHSVTVSVSGEALRVEWPDGSGDAIPASALSSVSDDARRVRLARTDVEGWSLLIDKPLEPEIAQLLPKSQRYGRWIDRVGLIPALVIGGLLTASILLIGHIAPHWIAPHVPMSWERSVGGAVVGDFGDLRCRDPKGQQALEDLVERVAPGATEGPDAIKVAALNVPVFNAAALPGGYIVVFKPAITESEPDALAGIVAHEVAHVRRRHVTEALIRELGIGALIRMFAGNLGANAEQLLALSYTRENETQADSDAIGMLRHAGISPKATATLFDRLSGEQEQSVSSSAEFLRSHPLSKSRAQKFAASFDGRTHYRPALNRDQADALFNICWKRPTIR